MAGLVPAISILNRDRRDKPGDDSSVQSQCRLVPAISIMSRGARRFELAGPIC
jgi:hypothetical protein